jgi:hypothetical protein
MIPVVGLDQVRISWIEIQKEGYVLYGFLLYTDTDQALRQYVSDGLIELDTMSGRECAIFVIDSPSKKWIEMTKRKEHIWWKLFGTEQHQSVSSESDARNENIIDARLRAISNNNDLIVQTGNNETVRLEQLLVPNLERIYDRNEAFQIASHFNIQRDQIPCLVFFKDIEGDMIDLVYLQQHETYDSLRMFFRWFFSSAYFLQLLSKAKMSNERRIQRN